MLTKTRRIYERRGERETLFLRDVAQLFVYEVDDDLDLIDSEILLSTPLWEDLGSPETITVTLEPGDHLNG